MRRALQMICMVVVFSTAALAVDGDQVLYSTGTLARVKSGSVGRFNFSSGSGFTFESSGGNATVTYSGLEAYTYEVRIARHLGVLPAIAVGLVRHRQQRHFFRFSFRDEAGTLQVAEFEVSKDAPPLLNSLLQQRAPRANCLANRCQMRPAQ